MRKTLFTGFAVLSLVLCITSICFWVRSYWVQDSYVNLRTDQFDIYDPKLHPQMRQIRSNRGAIHISSWRWQAVVPTTWVFQGGGWITFTEPQFAFSRTQTGWSLSFPHWLLASVAIFPPLFWLIRFRHHRRIVREGFCPKCGYDLRASTERCPECGTAIAIPAPLSSGEGTNTRRERRG